MNKFTAFIFFIFISFCAQAQSVALLIPRKIFTGDKAVLVLHLPGTDQNSDDIILTPLSPGFPSHDNIDFHKIIIERRTRGSRLLIEFTAFVPGHLELPVIEIEGYRFAGLTITVNSLLESRSSLVLSGPASSLAMPGTALMLYGTIAAFIVFILFTIWFIIKGRIFFQKWGNIFLRWKLFLSMKLREKQLHRAVLKGADSRIILDKLSDQFRMFLSLLTGNNCRSMTAHEFETQDFYPSLLENFFRNCDELRFSGINISSQDILKLLDDLRSFLKTLSASAELSNSRVEGFRITGARLRENAKRSEA